MTFGMKFPFVATAFLCRRFSAPTGYLIPSLQFFLIVAVSTTATFADDARGLLKKGSKAYEQKDYGQATEIFNQSAQQAQTEKLDPAVATFNQANATLKQGLADEATKLYEQALRSTDLKLQQKAYFNRGNALMQTSEGPETQQKPDEALKKVEEAIGMYEGAMALDPQDIDPKINYELALQKKMQLEEQVKQQQQQQQNQQENQGQKKDDQQQDQEQSKDQSEQEKQDQQEQQQDQKQQDEQQQNQESESSQDEQEGDQQQSQQPARPEEMTPEEARMLLDAMKQEEQSDREQMRLIMGKPVPVEKDW